MSGYFSQLAHHTGLDTKIGSGLASESTVAVQGPERAPEPMHVEEVSFTGEPAPDTAKGSNESPTTFPDRDRIAASTRDFRSPELEAAEDDAHVHGAEPTVKRETDPSQRVLRGASNTAFTNLAAATSSSREFSVVEHFPASQPLPAHADDRSSGDRQSLPQESIAIPYDSIEIVDSQSAAQDRETRRREAPRAEVKDARQSELTRDREPGEASRDGHVEREIIVGNYLKEVVAWVSSPPELDQREPESQRDLDQRPSPLRAEQDLASDSDAFAPQRKVPAGALRSNRSETMEAQDLSLSIGTISIVVEAPKQIAPALPQAPAKVDAPRERSASEPTRLSRYYLERW